MPDPLHEFMRRRFGTDTVRTILRPGCISIILLGGVLANAAALLWKLFG